MTLGAGEYSIEHRDGLPYIRFADGAVLPPVGGARKNDDDDGIKIPTLEDDGDPNVEFDDRQQKVISKLIEKVTARTAERWEAKAKKEIDAAKKEAERDLERLRQKYESANEAVESLREKVEKGAKGLTEAEIKQRIESALVKASEEHQRELAARDEQLTLERTRNESLQHGVVSRALEAAGAQADAIAPDLLAHLPHVRSRIQVDENGDPVVMTEDGKAPYERHDGKGGFVRVTVRDFVDEVLKADPRLKKGSPTPGAGTQPGSTNGGPGQGVRTTKDYNTLIQRGAQKRGIIPKV